MPAAIHTATDVPSLETAIIAVINAITPTYTEQQDEGWRNVEDNRPVPTATAVRLYDIEWGSLIEAGPTVFGGGTMFRQSVEMSVNTHYRGARSQKLGIMVAEDSNDLFKAIHDNTEQRSGANEVAGLVAFDHLGFTPIGDDKEQRVSHDFILHYMRAR